MIMENSRIPDRRTRRPCLMLPRPAAQHHEAGTHSPTRPLVDHEGQPGDEPSEPGPSPRKSKVNPGVHSVPADPERTRCGAGGTSVTEIPFLEPAAPWLLRRLGSCGADRAHQATRPPARAPRTSAAPRLPLRFDSRCASTPAASRPPRRLASRGASTPGGPPTPRSIVRQNVRPSRYLRTNIE